MTIEDVVENYLSNSIHKLSDEDLKLLIKGGRSQAMDRNNNWKGGRSKNGRGAAKVKCPGHPKADVNNYMNEYILIAEKALGKYLPDGTIVHHVDCDPTNDENSNLVICENERYHRLLHKRTKRMKYRKAQLNNI